MTREEAKEFGLNILHGIVARNEKSDSSYASLVKEAIDAITEPSLPSNLDEAAKKCVTSIIYEQGLYDGDFLIPVCEDIFKAGAKWDREQMLKKHIPKEHSELTELEYAFYDLLASNNITNHSDEEVVKTAKVTATDLMNIAKAEMMKEAVEGEIKDFRFVREINYSSAKIEFDSIPELKEGDRVRVIVLPKED